MVDKCYICGGNISEDNVEHDGNDSYTRYNCENCGPFKVHMQGRDFDNNKAASYLYYKCGIPSLTPNGKPDKKYLYLGYKKDIEEVQKRYPSPLRSATVEEVEAWYPRTFREKIDAILLGFSKLSEYDGSSIGMTHEQCCSAFFIKRYKLDNSETTKKERDDQIKFVENYLLESNFIKVENSSEKILITLLPNGLKRIYELQKNQSLNSKNVFVAMSFAKSMEKTRKAIRKAIEGTGYIPIIMDEKEHNNQIVPEMLYEIRQSKFVIAEFTEHNNGAYYEAGYAAGLGKEVIHVCNKISFNEDAHFDVKQVNTITWETEEELTKKLSMRIKATIE